MNLKELIASLSSIYKIYGDLPCVQIDMDGKINPFEIQPEVKYEQDDELLDFTDEKLSLKDLTGPVLLINPQL